MRARLQDVAARAGVSVKTVSNVVNDHPHVRAVTRERVEVAIRELGYRPHAVGRQLRRGRTGMIALALPELDVPYYAQLARRVGEATARRGYTMVVEQTSSSVDAERTVVDAREAGLVDGVLFSPVRMTAHEIEERAVGVPMVLLGEGPAPASVDHVSIDNEGAAREATQHLLDLGRRRPAFLGVQHGPTRTSALRHAGYLEALSQNGVQAHPALQLPVREYSHDEGDAVTTSALSTGAELDALLCTSDLLAVGALRALRRAGLTVPDDVVVVGWDDVPEAAYATPSLTTVATDPDDLAEQAVTMLLERIDGLGGPGRHAVLPHSLVVRESTGGEIPAPPDRAL